MDVLVTVREFDNKPLRGDAYVDPRQAHKRILVRSANSFKEAINAAELETGLPIIDCRVDVVPVRDRVDSDIPVINLAD